MDMIAQGAEAKIHVGQWHGRQVIVKQRVRKAYRKEELDTRLRGSRHRTEAQLMSLARGSGVRTPVIYDIDLEEFTMTMEYIEGQTAKDLLESSDNRDELAAEIGTCVGRLHRSDIVHGDLTTSNIIFRDGEPCFIDFGLGERSQEPEKKGVDMHLLKEAVSSAHSMHPGLFNSIAEAYVREYPRGSAILRIMKEIESRGRYS